MTAQPMDPKDVPEELLNAFKTAGYAAMMTPGATGGLSDRYLAGGLTAVVPLIRAQVADELTAHLAQERAQLADAEPITIEGLHRQTRGINTLDRVIATINRIARGDQ